MALELVTGYWGTEHVTAEQDADLQAGIIGKGCFVLPIGENMKAEAVTANKIRIFDGVFVGYGRQVYIEEGAYEDVVIENGTAGLLRNDMIIVKYKKDEVTGVEGVTFGVLKGQTGTKPVDPVPNNQDIRSGTFESEMPLYRVRLNGLAIEAIEKLYTIPKSNKELTDAVSQLNAELQIVEHIPVRSNNVDSNAKITQRAHISQLIVLCKNTLQMVAGTEYLLYTVADIGYIPATDTAKIVNIAVTTAELNIKKTGAITIRPNANIVSGTWIKIAETYI